MTNCADLAVVVNLVLRPGLSIYSESAYIIVVLHIEREQCCLKVGLVGIVAGTLLNVVLRDYMLSGGPSQHGENAKLTTHAGATVSKTCS